MQNPPQGPQRPQTGPIYPPMYQPQPTTPQYPTQPSQYPPQYPTQPTPQYPPQPPQYPSYYPQPSQPQNVYFQNQSFTNKAVIAFLLYWLGYVPGLIFNIMYLMEAHRIQNETGRTPSGIGCLWATLIGSLVPLLGFGAICFLIVATLAAAGGGATTH